MVPIILASRGWKCESYILQRFNNKTGRKGTDCTHNCDSKYEISINSTSSPFVDAVEEAQVHIVLLLYWPTGKLNTEVYRN